MGGARTTPHSAAQHAEPPKLTWARAVCSWPAVRSRLPVIPWAEPAQLNILQCSTRSSAESPACASMGGARTAQHSAVQHAEPPKLTWAKAVCSWPALQSRWPVGSLRGNRKSESHVLVVGKALGPTEEYLSAPSGCSDPWRCSRCSFDAASRVLLPRCPGDPSTTTSSTPSSLDM